jgi:hypothetical protein
LYRLLHDQIKTVEFRKLCGTHGETVDCILLFSVKYERNRTVRKHYKKFVQHNLVYSRYGLLTYEYVYVP